MSIKSKTFRFLSVLLLIFSLLVSVSSCTVSDDSKALISDIISELTDEYDESLDENELTEAETQPTEAENEQTEPETQLTEAENEQTEPEMQPTEAESEQTEPETKLVETESAKSEESVYYTFRSKKQYDDHFKKHGSEFGDITKQEYLDMANELIASSSDRVLHKMSNDNDYLFYDQDMNYFLVLSQDGYIRTFFRPSAGISYWNRQ